MNHGNAVVGIRLMILRDYLQANAGPNKAVKREELEQYLKDRRMRVEKKTIYRDLLVLINEFGLDLQYSAKHRGYLLMNPPFEPYELRLIVDSVQSSKFITREKAREITGKVRKLAGKDTAETLTHENIVASRVRSMNDSVMKDADRIHQAIKMDSKIGFRYFHYTPGMEGKKKYSKDGEQLIVSPYALLWNNGNYYLYAYDGNKFRYYRVDRMERISNPLVMARDGKQLYKEKDLTRQEAKVFDMYGGDRYTVRIRFRNELADAVIDQFGKDVGMFPCDSEHFIIQVPVEISPPFFAWIATFGRRVKLLSPEPVVEKMRDFLQKSMDMYKEEG